MASLDALVRRFYKGKKETSQLKGHLSMERLRGSQGWPKLKGQAAATRHLAPLGLQLARDHNSGSMHDQRRLVVAQSMVRFYELPESEGRDMSSDAKKELGIVGTKLCLAYSGLCKEASDAGVRGWKLVPKFHRFLHLCCHQIFYRGNP